MSTDTPSPAAKGRGGRLPDEMIPLAEVNERVAAAIRATLGYPDLSVETTV